MYQFKHIPHKDNEFDISEVVHTLEPWDVNCFELIKGFHYFLVANQFPEEVVLNTFKEFIEYMEE